MKGPVILLVEDHPDDVALTLRALEQSGVRAQVAVARDSDEALDYLHARGRHAERKQLPSLVLLDLKLPRHDGHELIRRMRAHALTRLVPVVVLTSSNQHHDILESYRHGANSYVRKPVDFVDFAEAVRQLGAYWLTLNRPPPSEELS